ncbi:MAG: YciI family protein [Acidimicrobiales bacterium]
MLLHATDEDLAAAMPWDETAQASLEAWLDQTISQRVNLHGSRLRPASDATTVKVRRGDLVVTDGPFAETKEQVAGYDVLECRDQEEALEWAGKHPTAQIGAIEVRPLHGDQPPARLPERSPGKRRYMMLVCTDPALQHDELGPAAPVEAWVQEMQGRGARRFGSQLEEPAQARTVRVRRGQALVTDGPFSETKEQVAGFDILDCADLDEAIEIAERHPMARHGILEVRPFWPFQQD